MANHAYAVLKGNTTKDKLTDALNEAATSLGEDTKIVRHGDDYWQLTSPHMEYAVDIYWNSARKLEWRHPPDQFSWWLLDTVMSIVSEKLNATHWLDDGLGENEKMSYDFRGKFPTFKDYKKAMLGIHWIGKSLSAIMPSDPRDNLFKDVTQDV